MRNTTPISLILSKIEKLVGVEQPTIVNESPVNPEQLRQTTGPGWIEIRNPQAEESTSNTTGGVITFKRALLPTTDPKRTIEAAISSGDSIANRTEQLRAALSPEQK
ncbi:MAG: hypothetical protein PHE48_03115 [Candidatus Daviesbacteria bacterium]|nr:hypothetical protein [Candidatus Daviesbacteria bacterium]